MDELLYQEMVDAGMDEGKARDIASRRAAAAQPEADVDGLRKALEAISAQQADTQGEREALQLDFDLFKGGAEKIVDALSKSGDALLDEHRAQNAAIAKGMVRIFETLDTVLERLGAVDELKKAMPAFQAALDTPAPRRATQVSLDIVPKGDQGVDSGWLPSTFNAAAGAALAGCTDKDRAAQLRKAISLSSSGQHVDLDGMAKHLNLTQPS